MNGAASLNLYLIILIHILVSVLNAKEELKKGAAILIIHIILKLHIYVPVQNA